MKVSSPILWWLQVGSDLEFPLWLMQNLLSGAEMWDSGRFAPSLVVCTDSMYLARVSDMGVGLFLSVVGSSRGWPGVRSTDCLQEPPTGHPHQRRLPARGLRVTETQDPQRWVSLASPPAPATTLACLLGCRRSQLCLLFQSGWYRLSGPNKASRGQPAIPPDSVQSKQSLRRLAVPVVLCSVSPPCLTTSLGGKNFT